MSAKTQRHTALGAVRSELRSQQRNPEEISANEALRVLDDISRSEPDLIASIWYRSASEYQINRFCTEWNIKALATHEIDHHSRHATSYGEGNYTAKPR